MGPGCKKVHKQMYQEMTDKARRAVERREARLQEIRVLIQMDGLDLSDPAVMSKGWRYWPQKLEPKPPT